jgi:cytochrome c553
LLVVLLASLYDATVSSVWAAAVEQRLTPCYACHGMRGESSVPNVPSLGGQPQFYVSAQLYMFRERIRDIEPMPEMLKGANDAELQQMAAVIGALPPPEPAAEPGDAARLERARLLIQQHRCNFCHNQDFSGEQGAPRLAAQREDYLIKALRDYKNNSRRAYDPSMADVMHPLTDADILDLAHYLARFR